MCSFDRQAKSVCRLETPSIPERFQYLDSPLQGGSDYLADYCPYPQPSTWCTNTQNVGRAFVDGGEEYCENCRCFLSNLLRWIPGGGPSRHSCHETYCTSPTTLKVRVGKVWYDCPSQREIPVKDYGGAITCPLVSQICGGAPKNNTWPIFTSIVPRRGEPGSEVTIQGANFVNGTTVSIGGECANVLVMNSTLIVAHLPPYAEFLDLEILIYQTHHVIITMPQTGWTAIGLNSFRFDVIINANLMKGLAVWTANHWFDFVIAAIVMFAVILSCYYCCCNCRKFVMVQTDNQ